MYVDLKVTGNELWKRFNADKKEIAWYYNSLVENLAELKEYKMYSEFKETVNSVFNS